MKASPTTEVTGMSGFATSGYIDKKGTPHGDGVMLNAMPPGMDITNQDVTDQRPMTLKTLVPLSYPGDGGGSSRSTVE